jgi:hypothetical protein
MGGEAGGRRAGHRAEGLPNPGRAPSSHALLMTDTPRGPSRSSRSATWPSADVVITSIATPKRAYAASLLSGSSANDPTSQGVGFGRRAAAGERAASVASMVSTTTGGLRQQANMLLAVTRQRLREHVFYSNSTEIRLAGVRCIRREQSKRFAPARVGPEAFRPKSQSTHIAAALARTPQQDSPFLWSRRTSS